MSGSRSLNGDASGVRVTSSFNLFKYLIYDIYIGGIVSVTLLGQPLIIVNSAKIMEDLDKKGSIYSDRPK